MNNAIRIAEIVLPVLVSLFLGWFSRLRNILNRAQIDGLKAFVVTYSLPAVLFMAFAEISYGLDVLLTCLVVFAACTAMLFIGRLFRRENPLLAFLVTGFEAGMMGYSLYTLLFGAENLSVMAVAALGGDVFVFTLYMAMLKRRDGVPPAQIARETLLSPIFLAVFAGILLGATGLWNAMRGNFLGAAVGAVADFLSGPTACAILFVVGYNIEFTPRIFARSRARGGHPPAFVRGFLRPLPALPYLDGRHERTFALGADFALLSAGAVCAARIRARRVRCALCVFVSFAVYAFVSSHVLRHRGAGRIGAPALTAPFMALPEARIAANPTCRVM